MIDIQLPEFKFRFLKAQLSAVKPYWRRSGAFASQRFYHYTNLEALLSIVERNVLWLSDVRYSNDRGEQIDCLELAKKLLKKLATVHGGGPWKKVLEAAVGRLDREVPRELFVTSFSKNKDSLSQWRGYCSVGTGVAICFRTSIKSNKHLKFLAMPQFVLSNVTYDDNVKRYLIKGMVSRFQKVFDADLADHGEDVIEDYAEYIVATIGLVSPAFKNSAFYEEAEIRLIGHVPFSEEGRRRYRVSSGRLIPYIEFGTNMKCFENLQFDIPEVIIAPSPEQQTIQMAVITMLQDHGFTKTKVLTSKIPYRRSW